RNMSKNSVTALQLHAEHRIGERLDDSGVNLNRLFLRAFLVLTFLRQMPSPNLPRACLPWHSHAGPTPAREDLLRGADSSRPPTRPGMRAASPYECVSRRALPRLRRTLRPCCEAISSARR